MFEFWLRTTTAHRLFVKDALLGILHDDTIKGVPRGEAEAYEVFLKLRIDEEENPKNILTPTQWDSVCHVCTEGDCEEPCTRKGNTRTKSLDIPTIISLIIALLTDLAPPKGRRGWSQPTPRLGDGGRAANILLARQLHARIKMSSIRDLKNEEQYEDLLDEIEIILIGLRYKNIQAFYKMKTTSLGKYYKMILQILDEKHDRMAEPITKVSPLEFETLKEGFEKYLRSMDQKALGDSTYTVISGMVQKQHSITKKLEEMEELSSSTGDVENLENGNEDNEQMLRCVVEGMKLHMAGDVEDEEGIIHLSNDLKEATKVRFEMSIEGCGNQNIDPSTIKLNLTSVTDGYYIKEYYETPGFIQSIREQVAKQKKFVQVEDKILRNEHLIKSVDQYVVLIGLEGSGKTTYIDTLLHQWGSNKLWVSDSSVEFHFVFVLYFHQLMRFHRQPGITAEEILQHFYPNIPIDLLVVLSEDINCLLILEGFDQFAGKNELLDKTEEPSFFTKAIYDLLNPQNQNLPFTRLVTTHPEGLRTLSGCSLIPSLESNDKINLRVVESNGFTFKSVNQYIANYFEDDPPPKELVDAVKEKRIMYDMMTVPSVCHGVCELIEYNLIMEDKLPSSYTSLLTLLLVARIWKRQFKEASTLNGVFIKPSFKESCLNLATVAYHLKLHQKVTFTLRDLPVESNIEGLLESGLIIKLNDNADKPRSYCYQFLHRVYQELLVAIYLFTSGFNKENDKIASNYILATIAGFVGATLTESTADSHLQKFAKLFDRQKIGLKNILEMSNGRDSERIQNLHSFLRSIREDDSKTSKELGKKLNKGGKSPADGGDAYDISPGPNTMILFEFGFGHFKEVAATLLSKPVAITMTPLRSVNVSPELRQLLIELSKEKKVKVV